MHKFILASGNAHKAEEFAKIFDPEVLNIEAAPEKLDVVEDGDTFTANALLKAKAYYDKFKKPVMADDSGICVEALPEELGIQSARFGGEGLSNEERARLLLKKMEGQENRNAYFVCVLCFYLGEDEVFFFEGRMNGEIANDYLGEHGFGYDPVFLPEGDHGGKTVAQLPEWKDENSHRAKACNQAEKFFREQNKN
jgi:XTP/dITP diphosphohydrolase